MLRSLINNITNSFNVSKSYFKLVSLKLPINREVGAWQQSVKMGQLVKVWCFNTVNHMLRSLNFFLFVLFNITFFLSMLDTNF